MREVLVVAVIPYVFERVVNRVYEVYGTDTYRSLPVFILRSRYLVKGNYPSGHNVADAMNNLQQHLFYLEQKRKPSPKCSGDSLFDWNPTDVVSDTAGGAASSSDDVGSHGKEGAELAREPGEGLMESGASPPGIKQGAAGGEEGARRRKYSRHPELSCDDADMFGERPEGWIHSATLVFSMFGRPSPNQDKDLEITECCGPPGRKRKGRTTTMGGEDASSPVDVTSSPEGGTGDGALSAQGLALMGGALGGAGGHHSRAKVKKALQKQQHTSNSSSVTDKVLELMKPVASKQAVAIAESVQTLTKAVVETAVRARLVEARAERQDRINSLQAKLKILQEIGAKDGEDWKATVKELITTLETPATVSTGPSTLTPTPDATSSPSPIPPLTPNSSSGAASSASSIQPPTPTSSSDYASSASSVLPLSRPSSTDATSPGSSVLSEITGILSV